VKQEGDVRRDHGFARLAPGAVARKHENAPVVQLAVALRFAVVLVSGA
jgi:hypothetical protein